MVYEEKNPEDAEKLFLQIYNEEKQKFDQLSLTNVDGVKIETTESQIECDLCDKFMEVRLGGCGWSRGITSTKLWQRFKEGFGKASLHTSKQTTGINGKTEFLLILF